MILLLMTAMVMGYVVRMVKDIIEESFMVGTKFSMVANLEVKQLNHFVEKMFALLQRIIHPHLHLSL